MAPLIDPHNFDPATAERYWYDALGQEVGVRIECDPADIRFIQNRLYEARARTGDPRLEEIMLFLPEGGKEIFMAKKTTDLGS